MPIPYATAFMESGTKPALRRIRCELAKGTFLQRIVLTRQLDGWSLWRIVLIGDNRPITVITDSRQAQRRQE